MTNKEEKKRIFFEQFWYEMTGYEKMFVSKDLIEKAYRQGYEDGMTN